MSAQLALPDGVQKRAHFLFVARGQKFDAAIAQIPHGTGDLKPFGYLPDRIAKTNALDVAFVENLEGGNHVTGKLIRYSVGGSR